MRKSALLILGLLILGLPVPAWATIVDIGTRTFAVPLNGTLPLSNRESSPLIGIFDIVGTPSYSGAGFAVLTMSAIVNGSTFIIEDALGSCPASFCGNYPYVTDNVYGTHLGPAGFSNFPIALSSPALSVDSSWNLEVLSGNIVVPSNYQVLVNVSLPAEVQAVPEASTLVMMILGLATVGLWTRYRRVPVLSRTSRRK